MANLAHPALVLIGRKGEAHAFSVLAQQLAGGDFKIALKRRCSAQLAFSQ
jgi:hypothetical protein